MTTPEQSVCLHGHPEFAGELVGRWEDDGSSHQQGQLSS